MTEANAAVDTVEKIEPTIEDAGRAVETAVADKAADTQAKGADAAGGAAVAEGAEVKGEPDKPAEISWPDDWRERLAGDDEAFLRTLKRYSSPNTFAKGFKEREEVIRSGKIQKAMPDATDEKAMAEWRKENNIPPDPSGYKLAEDITKRLVDDDKPLLANFMERAHKAGKTADEINFAAGWYVDAMEQVAEQRAVLDKEAHEATEDALRKEWAHGEYKANTKLAHSFLESVPGIGTEFATARMSNGKMLVQDPAFIAWAADMGREKFGDLAFVTGDSERRHTARRAEIEDIRKKDFARYEAEGLDRELRGMIEKDLARGKR